MAESKQSGVTLNFICAVFICCVGSSMLYGYNTAVLNTPQSLIKAFYLRVYNAREGIQTDKVTVNGNSTTYNVSSNDGNNGQEAGISDSQLKLLWSVTVSIYVAAGMFGAFVSAVVADSFGRKKGLIFNHVFAIVGSILSGLSLTCEAPEMLIAGRVFIGINCGMTVGLASLYLVEISSQSARGAVGACHQLAVTIGILLAQILGLSQILGTKDGWPFLVAMSALPASFSLITLPFFPESPRFLLLKRSDEDGARDALTRLRGTDDVSDELEEIRSEAKQTQAVQKFSMYKLFTTKELRIPVLIAIVLQVVQQWSGINAIFSYSGEIFDKSLGDDAQYGILGTGVINVFLTIACLPLLERFGRRSMLIWPTILMIVAEVVVTVSLNLESDKNEWLRYMSITMIHLYIVGFAVGLGPIPPVITAEIFRQDPRPAALAVGQVANWTCNFLLLLSFPFLQSSLGPYVFLMFLVVCLLGVIFTVALVPETKNRSFDEIANNLSFGLRQQSTVLLENEDQGGAAAEEKV